MFFYNEENGEVSQITPPSGDPYFNNVSLLLKMDTDFSDSSTSNHTITAYGSAAISSIESKYGGASALLPGGTSYLTLQNDSSLNFDSTEDFTIETWLYARSTGITHPTVFGNQAGPQHYGRLTLFYRHASSSPSNYILYYNTSSTGKVTLKSSIATIYNEWAHIAVVRSNNVLTLYINGVNAAQASHTYPVNADATGLFYIGVIGYLPDYHDANAYFDDFRVTKGIARYTADFTPPGSLPTSL